MSKIIQTKCFDEWFFHFRVQMRIKHSINQYSQERIDYIKTNYYSIGYRYDTAANEYYSSQCCAHTVPINNLG